MIGSARAGTTAETHHCEPGSCAVEVRALASAPGELCFPLDNGLTWMIGRQSHFKYSYSLIGRLCRGCPGGTLLVRPSASDALAR